MPASGFDSPSLASYRGEYINSVYEFSVLIPNSLVGYSSPPPAPAHGFGIMLGPKGDGYLWVDGSSNSLEYNSTKMAAHKISTYLKEKGAKIIRTEASHWKLGEFPATRMKVWYRCPNLPEQFIDDEVIAISPNKSQIWEVGLDTKLGRYDEDRGIYESILKSWRYRQGR